MSGCSSRSIRSRAAGSPAWAAANTVSSTRITADLRAACGRPGNKRGQASAPSFPWNPCSCGKTFHHLDLPDHGGHHRQGGAFDRKGFNKVLKAVAVLVLPRGRGRSEGGGRTRPCGTWGCRAERKQCTDL